MDHQRFDDLARVWATPGVSRRRLLKTLVLTSVGGALASVRGGAAAQDVCAAIACPDGEIQDDNCVCVPAEPVGCGDLLDCGGSCVDPTFDPANCGDCGIFCESGVCEGGTCVEVGCDSGLTDCNGVCVDTAFDPTNCGDCGSFCESGICEEGACGEVGCEVGLTDCDGICAALESDPSNCGVCGNVCESGECVDGECGGCGACIALEGYACCDDACVDTNADRDHCGDCNVVCGDEEGCCDGACVDVLADPTNCGTCGTVCDSGTCTDGACETDRCGGCESAGSAICCGTECCQTFDEASGTYDHDCCDDTCADLLTDPNHCGACGIVCDGGTCDDGTCRPVCDCPADAGTECCDDVCVDTLTDPDHCGACANVCPDGQGCVDGRCEPTCERDSDCDRDDPCTVGVCEAGVCAYEVVECDAGTVCCKGAREVTCCQSGRPCVDGACGCDDDRDCDRDDPCTAGTCDGGTCSYTVEECGVDAVCCKGTGGVVCCADGRPCVDGACGCDRGRADCDGTCVDLDNERRHCGACGRVCQPSETCRDGVCSCGTGLTACGGACVNTDSAPTNCGKCGVVCPSGLSCAGGRCGASASIAALAASSLVVVTAVPSDYSDDLCISAFGMASPVEQTIFADTHAAVGQSRTLGPFAPGAELVFWLAPLPGSVCTATRYFSTDPLHAQVASRGASAWRLYWEDLDSSVSDFDYNDFLVDVELSEPRCAAGETDCDGTCADTATDPRHCGQCGRACGPGETCADGECVTTCPPGQTACGTICTDTDRDPNNCGACGNGCSSGTACEDGVCAPQGVEGLEIDYFALGDSIASGHGLMDEDKLQCNPRVCCRRSKKSYPYKVRESLAKHYAKVNFKHFVCTGATSLGPIALNELVSPIPEEDIVPQPKNGNRLKLLRNQIKDVLNSLDFRRKTIVTITIGANDFEFAEESELRRRLFINFEDIVRDLDKFRNFDDWAAERALEVRREVAREIRLLLEHENVSVVLTEVFNPFNRDSVFFVGPLGIRCPTCYGRTQVATRLLNEALKGVVADLGGNRIQLAEIHAEFEGHKSPRGEEYNHRMGQYVTIRRRRHSCGYAQPDIGKPGIGDQPRAVGTWIQHRADEQSNSFSVPENFDCYEKKDGKCPEWRGDCFHPNEDGATFIAGRVFQRARTLLRPKVTSGPAASGVTATSATIAWTSDVPSIGTVEYGPTTAFGERASNGDFVTNHRVVLSKLEPDTKYYYRVRTKDGTGLEDVTRKNRSFRTTSECVSGGACGSDADCCDFTESCVSGACMPSRCRPGEGFAPGGSDTSYVSCGQPCFCTTTTEGRGWCGLAGTNRCGRNDQTPCSTTSDCKPNHACVVTSDGEPACCWPACRGVGASSGHVTVMSLVCADVPVPELTVYVYVRGAGAPDPGPYCSISDRFTFTITDKGGSQTPVIGDAQLDLPLGSYTITEDTTGVSADFAVTPDLTPEGIRITFATGAAAELPSFFVGRWEGTGTQTKPATEWPIVMTLAGGGIGSVIGTTAYPSLECDGELTLRRLNPEITFRAVEAAEVITTNRDNCLDGVFALGPTDVEAGLAFSWTSDDGTTTATGVLHRVDDGERPPTGDDPTLRIELTVEGMPPEGTAFAVSLVPPDAGHFVCKELTDPDGDGVYISDNVAGPSFPDGKDTAWYGGTVKYGLGFRGDGYSQPGSSCFAGPDDDIEGFDGFEVTEDTVLRASVAFGAPIETASLAALLPTEDEVPPGLVLIDEGGRSADEITATFPDPDEAAALFADWAWEENAYRDFAAADDDGLSADATTSLSANLHRFGDAASAGAALPYLVDARITALGMEPLGVSVLGDQAGAIAGATDVGYEVSVYVRRGDIVARVSAVSPAGDPTADAMNVVEAFLAK